MNTNPQILFTLNHRVAIYVPSTANVNQSVDNAPQVKLVMARMSQFFGGATATHAVGGWVSETKGLVTEKVTIVYAYATQEALDKYIPDVLQLAHDLCTTMSQDCVAVELNNTLQFIK